MTTKNRQIEVLSVSLTFSENNQSISFVDILNYINGQEYRCREKLFNLSLLSTSKPNCIVGIIVTTQDSDIPPKRNKRTGAYNQVQINTEEEGFAYANIFIYDYSRNILLYEINKNGCFPNQLKEFIYNKWNSEEDHIRFDIKFPAIVRLNEYQRMLDMDRYKRIKIELYNPSELVNSLNESVDSIYNNIINNNINLGAQTNANTITIEQVALQRRYNPNGLSRSMVKGLVDAVRLLSRNNIQTLSVEGYDFNSEDPNRCKPIDLIADSFKESFKIPDVQIHSDVQQSERKEGIETLYERLLPEFRQIIGF